jgi:hypothetical protein
MPLSVGVFARPRNSAARTPAGPETWQLLRSRLTQLPVAFHVLADANGPGHLLVQARMLQAPLVAAAPLEAAAPSQATAQQPHRQQDQAERADDNPAGGGVQGAGALRCGSGGL